MLLADDSAAVQKVIELTFADEGIEVISVGDGQTALEKLEYFAPDVVLADAFMPGLNGYELCRSMKGDHRFAQIPVMLLVSSFAPFDEVEAQRAGADDIMTKPFQSIRQLVSRVDSLLSGRRPIADAGGEQAAERSSEFDAPPIPVEVEESQPNVTVLVEAAQMEAALPHESEGGACAPDIGFQTADTAQLQTVRDATEDTIEIEPQFDDAGASEPSPQAALPEAVFEYQNHTSMNETFVPQSTPTRFTESLLELDETDYGASSIDDELILDLDLEPTSDVYASAVSQSDVATAEQAITPEPMVGEEVVASTWLDHAPVAIETEAAATTESRAQVHSETSSAAMTQSELSPQAIDEIARRVVEQMSEKVVREIAWEVVPELSELMIKKKLEQR